MITARMEGIASTKETARAVLGAAAQAVAVAAATKARDGDSKVTVASAAAVVRDPQHLHHRHNSSSYPFVCWMRGVGVFHFCPDSSLEFLNYFFFDFMLLGSYSQMIS